MAVPRESPRGARRRPGAADGGLPRRLALLLPAAALLRLLGGPAEPARQGASHPHAAFFEVFTGGQASPEDPNQQKGEQAPAEQDMDWKEAAWKAQQERVAMRKAKQSPDYKKSAKEILLQRKKDMVWKQMSTRNSEGVLSAKDMFDADAGEIIKVKLQKPLGIDFILVNPAEEDAGVMIGDILEGSNADKTEKLAIGDVLVSVDKTRVFGKGLDEGLQPIVDAEGEMEVVFFRQEF